MKIRKNKVGTYNTVAEAYTQEFNRLLSIAKSRLHNQDHAVDCVHEAFKKILEYKLKHTSRKISGFILRSEVIRATQRMNKQSGIELTILDRSNDGRFDNDSDAV